MTKNKGHENLIPLAERTEEERKAIASKGGKAKAEKERQRKVVAETFNAILSLEYDTKRLVAIDHSFTYGDFQMDLQGQTVLTSVCAKVVAKALKGDMRATETILKYIEPVE